MMIHIMQRLLETHTGAIAGLQGGTNKIKKLIESFSEAKFPSLSAETTLKLNENDQQSHRGESYWQVPAKLSGVWLQDWVYGCDRLQWN